MQTHPEIDVAATLARQHEKRKLLVRYVAMETERTRMLQCWSASARTAQAVHSFCAKTSVMYKRASL